MTTTSLPEDRHLDPILVKILGSVDATAKSQGSPYLLSGAMAREILLVHVHGLPPGRATRDVDFGVMVRDWDAFARFKKALVARGDFVDDTAIQQRLYTVLERFGVRMMVDLVPFGPIEAPKGSISWPPEREVVMDVRGFQVGLLNALKVEIQPGLIVPIPRPEAMVLMKLLAWKDRGAVTQGRDAMDVVELLERGEDLVGLDRLYDDHLGVMEHHGGDPRLAGAEVLGQWASASSPDALVSEVRMILERGLVSNFITQVMATRGGSGGSDRYAAMEALVRAFLQGLEFQETGFIIAPRSRQTSE